MELYLLDKAFQRRSGPLDCAVSVVWSMRFYECGTFRAIFPMSPGLFEAVRSATYLSTGAAEDGFARCGRIEYVGCTGDSRLEVSGRMLESLLDQRILSSPVAYTGSLSAGVLSVVTANLRGLDITVGADSAEVLESVSLTGAWESLMGWVYRVLKHFDLSFEIRLDTVTSHPVFRIVKPGKEAKAIFSRSYGNIASLSYEQYTAKRRNAVYVEGYDGTVAEVDQSVAGEERLELYEKAGDVRPTQFSTTAAYTEALRLRGRTVLAKHQGDEYITCTADSDAGPVYGVDYRLGDRCFLSDSETGLAMETQVTEADEVWEGGLCRIYPGFGEKLPCMNTTI